jgi:hypothetical protein
MTFLLNVLGTLFLCGAAWLLATGIIRFIKEK